MQEAEAVTFGGAGLDRAGHLRSDPVRLAALQCDTRARVLPVWRGKPLLTDVDASGATTLRWLTCDNPSLPDGCPVLFLGLDPDAGPRFAVDFSGWEPPELPPTLGAFADPSEQRHPGLPGARFAELRASMTALGPRDAELVATARGVLSWHRSHGFCPNCGTASDLAPGGWHRDCSACGTRAFPRTDPVVIMLVTHGNDVLLGRSPGWPERMFSLLAGFVEPGETVEAAVRRETFEEAAIRIGRVDYLASQPWPFPASLMIGCHGHATSRDIAIDPVELEAAQWVSREQMAQVFRGAHPAIAPARPGAIAHFLLSRWLADRLD